MADTNWAGNYTYRAEIVHHPSTVDELAALVASRPKLRLIGSRHTFSSISDAAEQVSLDLMPVDISVDASAQTVTVRGQVSYGELAARLQRDGMALANLASLPHISVAGAVATATHGSGDRSGNLATAVAGVELLTSSGELWRFSRSDADFGGIVVSLGALGAVTAVTLDVELDYQVRQRVFEGLPWEALLTNFDGVTGAGDSVSVFALWDEPTVNVWVKSRVGNEPEAVRDELFGARPARTDRHVIDGHDPDNCTPQLGVAGPWAERLPHFRMGFTPSSGEEIQSEYLVQRRHAVDAIDALRAIGVGLRPLLHVSEIRTVAADEMWLSPQYGTDTVGIHFTWRRDQEAVERALVDVEAALAPFEPRPHWGKLFLADAATLAARYPRLGDFAALAARLDSRGAFANDWIARHVLPGSGTD